MELALCSILMWTCLDEKLLKLLDDVEQFFLWVVAAALDGRKTNFDWLAPVWDHRDEWPNVTKEYKNVYQLQFEVERNLALAGERRFVTLHFHPFEMRSPSTNRCFWGRL